MIPWTSLSFETLIGIIKHFFSYLKIHLSFRTLERLPNNRSNFIFNTTGFKFGKAAGYGAAGGAVAGAAKKGGLAAAGGAAGFKVS